MEDPRRDRGSIYIFMMSMYQQAIDHYGDTEREFTLAELNKAIVIISQMDTVTDAMLHTAMKIPYMKAYKLIDYLEDHGMVSIQIRDEDRDVYTDENFII